MTSRERFEIIGECLNRYEGIHDNLPGERFDRFIDLDVSKIDVEKLIKSNTEDFMHDMIGVFTNLKRNSDDPEKSVLKMFVPRCGLLKEAA